MCVYHSALIALPITSVFGVRPAFERLLRSLIFTQTHCSEWLGEKKQKVHDGPGEPYKSELCLRHSSPPEETQEEFHHFDTALITTDAFRIRPNSICLSQAFFV